MNSFARKFVLYTCTGAAGLLWAQQDQTVEWRQSLQDLEHRLAALPGEAGASALRSDAESLRSTLADFAAAHPEMKLQLPEALPESPTHDGMAQQLQQLNAAVNQVVQHTPGTPFDPGHIEVNVTATVVEQSPVTVGIDQTEISNLYLVNAAKALDYLPGVSIQHLSANRNEAGIMVRGFSTRGQVPLYIDSILISVPYDGYVDFNRYLTSDIGEIQVARGYSTPLLGPNAEGGTINMVTVEPVKKFGADALIGTGSGDTLLAGLRIGSRWEHFFFNLRYRF